MYRSMFIPGDPVPQPRPRITVRGRHGVAYVPRGHAIHQWRAAIREEMERCVAESGHMFPINGVGLRARMVFHLRQPKRNRKRLPIGRPDLDNLAKAVLDAGNGVIWSDDSQVTEMVVSKRWHDHPGVWLEIWEATE